MKVTSLLIVGISMAFFSCNSSSEGHFQKQKIDTLVNMIFSFKDKDGKTIGPYRDTVISQLISRYVFVDTANNKGGHWVTDTSNFGRIADDTARDALRRPLFDSLHHPLSHFSFYPIPPHYLQPYLLPTK